MIKIALNATAIWALLFTPIEAQGRRSEGARSAPEIVSADHCGPHRATIVQIADRILAERRMLTGFGPPNFGSLALFLKLRQQDMGLDAGLLLMADQDGTRRERPRMLTELRLMFAIFKYGVDQGLRINGNSELEEFAKAHFLVARQIVLADSGESYFRLWGELRGDAALSEVFEKTFYNGIFIAGLLSDQSDALKLAVAERAQAAGLMAMAGYILGSRQDLSAYFTLAQTSEAKADPSFPTPNDLNSHGLIGLTQSEPLIDTTATRDRQERDRDEFAILRAALQMSGLAWLGIVYNQTGEREAVANAARAFSKEVEAGRLQPLIDMEGAWWALQTVLIEEMGRETYVATMASFDISPSIRHYGRRAGEMLDWIAAIATLTPYMRGAAQDVPRAPEFNSDVIDWPVWLETAAQLRKGTVNWAGQTDPMRQKIAVELLFGAGDVIGALGVAGLVAQTKDRLEIYRDLLLRLDQRCDGFSVFAGGALLLGGQPLYHFD